MEYRVINDFRPEMPQTKTGMVGPFRMIALHDTEGGVGDVGSRNTANFLVSTAADRNASYHELWGWDEATKVFTVRRIVPPTSAAHSVNPFPPPGGSYQPDAYVRAALGDRWQDPNRVIYAVSISGKVADVNRWSEDPDFVAACARRLAELERDLMALPHRGEHFRINPSTRSDWGKLLTPKLTQKEDMPMLARYAIERITIDKSARIRNAPTINSEKSYLTPADRFASAVRVGTLDNSEGEWSVYWVRAWNSWGYTLKQNVIKVDPIDLTPPVVEDLSDELATATAKLTAAQDLVNKKNSALATISATADTARKLL